MISLSAEISQAPAVSSCQKTGVRGQISSKMEERDVKTGCGFNWKFRWTRFKTKKENFNEVSIINFQISGLEWISNTKGRYYYQKSLFKNCK